MKLYKSIFILIFVMALCLIPLKNSLSGGLQPNFLFYNDTDSGNTNVPFGYITYFFDLRDRETFIQLTYPAFIDSAGFTGDPALAHIQIYDVSNNCNENDFFDLYTPNDTHIYNMRNIETNDGNPSGVVLPDGAYGIVAVYIRSATFPVQNPFGNMRIIDNNGYEYRTNAQYQHSFEVVEDFDPSSAFYSFNFNQKDGVSLSDVVGITFLDRADDNFIVDGFAIIDFTEAADVANIFYPFDVDILDNSENLFSCRNIIFSCVDQDNPRLEELLENAQTANVASFEYGINEAIPHSKGGELLCPGNTIPEGIVKLTPLGIPQSVLDANQPPPGLNGVTRPFFYGYIGLNNGNDRGSFDSFWINSACVNTGSTFCGPI